MVRFSLPSLSISLLLALAVLPPAGAAPHPSLPPAGSPEGFGVNIHFTHAQPGELEMIRQTGFRWVRMDFSWSGTEREKGQYDFSAYDVLADGLARNGLKALFILDYSNNLYSPGGRSSPEDPAAATEFRAAFAHWSVAAAKHFAGRGYLWEIWNEPNIGFWKPKPDVEAYVAMAMEASRAIKKEVPGEAVIGPATSGIDLKFIETCCERGLLQYWDAVSVHPYRQTAPETARDEYAALRALIARHAPKGRDIPILAGEWGYSTGWKGYSNERQADHVVREMGTNLAEGVPLTIWYDWRDDGDDPKEPEHRFGLVRRAFRAGAELPFEPKPAWTALHTLSTRIEGLRFNKRLIVSAAGKGADGEILLFSAADKEMLVVFEQDGVAQDMVLPLGNPSEVKVLKADGSETTPSPGRTWTFGDLPKPVAYILPKTRDEALSLAAAWPTVPRRVAVKAAAARSIDLSFANPLDKPVRVVGGQGEISPGSRIASSVDLSDLARLDPRNGGAGVGIRTLTAKFSLDGLPELRQSVVVEVTDALTLDVATPGPAGLPLCFTNPSPTAWTATAVFRSADGAEILPGLPVKITDGQKAAVIMLAGPPPGAASVEIREKSGEPSRFPIPVAVAGFEAGFLNTRPEGDKDVKSEVRVEAASGASSPSGGAVTKLNYKFGEGWSYAPVEWNRPQADNLPVVPDKAEFYCIWVHGDGLGASPRIRTVDAGGQTFQFTGPDIDWKGWRFIAIPLDPKRAGHWGGADDGKVRPPLRLATPFLLDPGRKPLQGELLLAAPAWLGR